MFSWTLQNHSIIAINYCHIIENFSQHDLNVQLFPTLTIDSSLTLSSVSSFRSFMRSWNRRKLLVPIGCNSNSLHRATRDSCCRLSNVSSSRNNVENRRISSLLVSSPELRIWKLQQNNHWYENNHCKNNWNFKVNPRNNNQTLKEF